MSNNQNTDPKPQDINETVNPEPEIPESPVETQAAPVGTQPEPADAAAPAQDPESTIGTGTSMALGCVAGTVLLIGFGLLFLFISTLR